MKEEHLQLRAAPPDDDRHSGRCLGHPTILREMRLAWPGVVLIGLIGGAIVAVFVLWFGGCAVASVDESDYVAHNEPVYRTLPEYPGATLTYSAAGRGEGRRHTWAVPRARPHSSKGPRRCISLPAHRETVA